VPDVSGKAIANLEIESLRHVAPTFHGDTLYGETTVLGKRESTSKDDRGVVQVETVGYNQDGKVVCIFRRKVLVPKQSYLDALGGEQPGRPVPRPDESWPDRSQPDKSRAAVPPPSEQTQRMSDTNNSGSGSSDVLDAARVAGEQLAAWTFRGDSLSATFESGDFATGLRLVNKIGALAEAMNHHPALDLRYDHVAVRLTSHDAGGVTARDVRMARSIAEHAAGEGITPRADD